MKNKINQDFVCYDYEASDIASWIGGTATEEVRLAIEEDLKRPDSSVRALYEWIADPSKAGRPNELMPDALKSLQKAQRRMSKDTRPKFPRMPKGIATGSIALGAFLAGFLLKGYLSKQNVAIDKQKNEVVAAKPSNNPDLLSHIESVEPKNQGVTTPLPPADLKPVVPPLPKSDEKFFKMMLSRLEAQARILEEEDATDRRKTDYAAAYERLMSNFPDRLDEIEQHGLVSSIYRLCKQEIDYLFKTEPPGINMLGKLNRITPISDMPYYVWGLIKRNYSADKQLPTDKAEIRRYRGWRREIQDYRRAGNALPVELSEAILSFVRRTARPSDVIDDLDVEVNILMDIHLEAESFSEAIPEIREIKAKLLDLQKSGAVLTDNQRNFLDRLAREKPPE